MPAARSSSSLAASSRLRSGGEPNAASSLAHIERAAATLTCWPTIVRSKVCAPRSLLRGSGMPCFSTHAGEGRLAARRAPRRGCGCCSWSGPSGDARRIERDRGGVGDVEAFDRVADRQPRQRVAMLARVGPQARPFGAEHQRDARRAERVLELRVGVAGQADPPEAGLADLLERAGEVDDARPTARARARPTRPWRRRRFRAANGGPG